MLWFKLYTMPQRKLTYFIKIIKTCLPFSQIYQSLLTSDPEMQNNSSFQKILNLWDWKMFVRIKNENPFLCSILKIWDLHIPSKQYDVLLRQEWHFSLLFSLMRETELFEDISNILECSFGPKDLESNLSLTHI